MNLRKIILRRKNEDTEGDKYEYFLSCKNGIEMVTPFKDKATILNEGEELKVVNKDWKAMLAPKKKDKSFEEWTDEIFEFNQSIGIGTGKSNLIK